MRGDRLAGNSAAEGAIGLLGDARVVERRRRGAVGFEARGPLAHHVRRIGRHAADPGHGAGERRLAARREPGDAQRERSARPPPQAVGERKQVLRLVAVAAQERDLRSHPRARDREQGEQRVVAGIAARGAVAAQHRARGPVAVAQLERP